MIISMVRCSKPFLRIIVTNRSKSYEMMYWPSPPPSFLMVKNQSTPALSYISPTDSSSRLSSTTKQPPTALPTVLNHDF